MGIAYRNNELVGIAYGGNELVGLAYGDKILYEAGSGGIPSDALTLTLNLNLPNTRGLAILNAGFVVPAAFAVLGGDTQEYITRFFYYAQWGAVCIAFNLHPGDAPDAIRINGTLYPYARERQLGYTVYTYEGPSFVDTGTSITIELIYFKTGGITRSLHVQTLTFTTPRRAGDLLARPYPRLTIPASHSDTGSQVSYGLTRCYWDAANRGLIITLDTVAEHPAALRTTRFGQVMLYTYSTAISIGGGTGFVYTSTSSFASLGVTLGRSVTVDFIYED